MAMMSTPQSWYRDAREQAERHPKHTRDHAAMWLGTLTKALPEIPRERVIEELKKFNRERLDAVPSLTKYPELRGMRELVEAGWRGTRDGAQMDDETWASYCGAPQFYFRFVSSRKLARFHANCSYVYFPTSEVGPILANNLDTTPAEPFTEPQWPAVNEHLIMGGVSSGVYFDEESPEIFPAPVYSLVARYCRSTAEAVEMLERYNYFWGPGNTLVVDRDHKVAMIEKSATRIGVRYSPDGFGFITAMTQEHPEMQKYVRGKRAESLKARGLPEDCADAHYWGLQDKRQRLMTELLDEARKNPTVENLRKIIQFRS